MGKKIAVTFVISVLSMITIAIIMLMIMLPQQKLSVETTEKKYQPINSSDYQYVQTKDITKEALVKQYIITDADLALFKKYNQYTPGNSDPFTPSSDLNAATNSNNQTTTNSNTTNSNNGVASPDNTNK